MRAAAQIVAGATVTAAAEAAGVSTRTMHSDLRQPEVRAQLASMYQEHEARLRALFARSLDAIDDALGATRGGKPAHLTRLKAASELRHLVDVGARFATGQSAHEAVGLPAWEELKCVVLSLRSQRSPS